MTIEVAAAFLRAHHEEARALGNPEVTGDLDTKAIAEILENQRLPSLPAVLDRLPPELAAYDDRQLVDLIDGAMDSLFRRRVLAIPGHRWLADTPPSIRGELVDFFERGHLVRDPATRRWSTKELVYRYSILEPPLKAAIEKLLGR
jgi:hypothetical protein